MQIAVLADVHGNLPALEAVLARLEEVQPDYVVLNGDLINGVPFSTEVIDLVRRLGWVVVRGNHEFYYLDFGTERAIPGCEDPTRWGQLHWLIDTITPAQGAYLAMLPDERTLYVPGTQPIRVAHGVPGRNRVGFHNEQADEQIAAEIRPIQERPWFRPTPMCRSIGIFAWTLIARAPYRLIPMSIPTPLTTPKCIGTGT
ncbi:MAG: metallophosphoesterase [Caldilineaceae bacterium]